MLISLTKEREERREHKKYACPECRKKGKSCAKWIIEAFLDKKKFNELSIAERTEVLQHTMHLRAHLLHS